MRHGGIQDIRAYQTKRQPTDQSSDQLTKLTSSKTKETTREGHNRVDLTETEVKYQTINQSREM